MKQIISVACNVSSELPQNFLIAGRDSSETYADPFRQVEFDLNDATVETFRRAATDDSDDQDEYYSDTEDNEGTMNNGRTSRTPTRTKKSPTRPASGKRSATKKTSRANLVDELASAVEKLGIEGASFQNQYAFPCLVKTCP